MGPARRLRVAFAAMTPRGEQEGSGSGDWLDEPGTVPEEEGGRSPAPERDRTGHRERTRDRGVMIPVRAGRSFIETLLMRLVATAGIIGIGVAIAAIMHSQKSEGWLIGLVVSAVSVILAAVLWSSRRL